MRRIKLLKIVTPAPSTTPAPPAPPALLCNRTGYYPAVMAR